MKARELSDEEESFDGRADYRDAEAARVRGEDGGSLLGAWDQCGDVLPVEAEVRRHGREEAHRLRALEDENRRLKMLVAEPSLDG